MSEHTPDPFDGAAFYDARESERLTHTEVEDAVSEACEMAVAGRFADGKWGTGAEVEAEIRRACPMTIEAFRRKEVTDAWVQRAAARAAEVVQESFAEEFGDPEGDGDALAPLAGLLAPAVRTAVTGVEVWACEVVAARSFSADEVVEMMRKWNPDWFDENSGAGEHLA